MHWGQIKTLLILSFFVLDIYLVSQLIDKRGLADLAIWERQSSSVEEQLEAESITIGTLPTEEYEESYISVKQHHFEEESLVKYKDNVKQSPYIFQQDLIMSILDEPMKVSPSSTNEDMKELLNQIAFFPETYEFWNWNKDLNVVMYFQTKYKRNIYYNQNAIVLFFLNEENEVEYYLQTMLGESKRLTDKQKLIKPMRAIETLYNENELHADDDIGNVKVGFHTRVPSESGVQVFAPIWKVNVNNEHDYFVNAIEGYIFSTNEEEFLSSVIQNTVDRLKVIKDDDTSLLEVKEDLMKRIEEHNIEG